MSIIEVKNLTWKFGDLTAIDDLSFTIAEGDRLGLLEPNGTCETTKVRMPCSLVLGRYKRNGAM